MQMTNFNDVLPFVLKHEGGLVDNIYDAGGITNCGISLRFLKSLESLSPDYLKKNYEISSPVNKNTIRKLKSWQIEKLYRLEFWEKTLLSEVNNLRIARYIFDMIINHGLVSAILMVQRAINVAKLEINAVKVDGILGNATIEALNNSHDDNIFARCLVAMRVACYYALVKKIPSNMIFLKGWLGRAFDY